MADRLFKPGQRVIFDLGVLKGKTGTFLRTDGKRAVIDADGKAYRPWLSQVTAA